MDRLRARVSAGDQHTDRQLAGIDVEEDSADKASGKDLKRPQLAAILDFVREGDAVVVHSMDRLARNHDRTSVSHENLVAIR